MSRLIRMSLTLLASFVLLAGPASAQYGGSWLQNYLSQYSNTSTVQPVSAIPEPTGALLFSVGAIVIAAARRKNKAGTP